MVNRKLTKLPVVWSSKLSKRYKSNAIIRDLYRSQRILMVFADEVKHNKTKFLKAHYPLDFVESIIRKFQSTMVAEDSFIIPSNLKEINLLF